VAAHPGNQDLSARMDAQCKAPMRWRGGLPCNHGASEVFYPGPGKITKGMTIIKSQSSGFGAVASVKLDSVERGPKDHRNALKFGTSQ